MSLPRYSFVIPTYKRPDVLRDCLQHISRLEYPSEHFNVFVIDNGENDHCRDVAEPFSDSLDLQYEVNEQNLGPGGSLNKGLKLANGERIVISNDDAMVPTHFLQRCDEIFDLDPTVGCVGFRAIEEGYESHGSEIGVISDAGRVVGNFDRVTEHPIDVDHVYGFCYAVTRTAIRVAGGFDAPLLAKIYASGNRIETDHCMSMKRNGLRVLYDGQTGIPHLAKPRIDIQERSAKWRLNEIRNTLYLLLKQYGWFGHRGTAIRYATLHDLGIRSLIRRPSVQNAKYVLWGFRAKSSAIAHWGIYLAQGDKASKIYSSSDSELTN